LGFDVGLAFLIKVLPDFVVAFLDDVGDLAEQEAELRGLIEIESDEEWAVSRMAEALAAMDDIRLHLLLEKLETGQRQRILEKIEELNRG
jgi:hypothetical protein